MSNSITKLIAMTALAMIALGATACNGAPSIPNAAPAPASAPTSAPAPTNVAPATTSDAQGNSQRGGRIEDALKNRGLTIGVVRASNENGLALKTPNGNDKVRVDSSTIIIIPGKTNAKVTDIQTGDRVVVNVDGKKSAANMVMVVPSNYTMDNLVLGAVQSSASGSLTLRTRGGVDQVTTNSNTVVVKSDSDQPTLGALSDIKQGNAVIVVGEKTDKAVTAQVVVIVKEDLRGALNRGPVPPKGKQPLPQPTPGAGG